MNGHLAYLCMWYFVQAGLPIQRRLHAIRYKAIEHQESWIIGLIIAHSVLYESMP